MAGAVVEHLQGEDVDRGSKRNVRAFKQSGVDRGGALRGEAFDQRSGQGGPVRFNDRAVGLRDRFGLGRFLRRILQPDIAGADIRLAVGAERDDDSGYGKRFSGPCRLAVLQLVDAFGNRVEAGLLVLVKLTLDLPQGIGFRGERFQFALLFGR